MKSKQEEKKTMSDEAFYRWVNYEVYGPSLKPPEQKKTEPELKESK